MINTSTYYKSKHWLLAVLAFLCFYGKAQFYFPPPLASTAVWDTVSPASLGWCTNHLDTLNNYVKQANSKSFIILHKGKIAVEWYYDGFTKDSVWYWASAAKTLKAFMIGQLQEDGQLSISDKSSDYLGARWSSCPPAKEDLITVENQLTMTTGLDYQVSNQDCTIDTCLHYKADAGTEWYYYNAPYLLLRDVIEQASNQNLNTYTLQNLAQPIGMQGLWFDNLYVSNARSMARFGLLNLNNGVWNGNAVLSDTSYFNAMISTSQNLNPAYGYLWWLNGKSTYIQPGLPNTFNGQITPSAPADMYMAAGKNDQRIYVVPSLDIVVVRQGDAANQALLAISGFDDELWRLIMQVVCTNLGEQENTLNKHSVHVFPNPVVDFLHTNLKEGQESVVYTVSGVELMRSQKPIIDVSTLPAGQYILRAANTSVTFTKQ